MENIFQRRAGPTAECCTGGDLVAAVSFVSEFYEEIKDHLKKCKICRGKYEELKSRKIVIAGGKN